MENRQPVTLSVIAPCYNEAGNIPELVERLQRMFEGKGLSGEIVLVNDCSKDNTGEVIARQAAIYPNIVAVNHTQNRGIVGGWRSGVAAATGVYTCLMDADLQHLPEDVGRLYDEIMFSRFDVVQGWRNHVKNSSGMRVVLSKGLNTALNVLFGMDSKDNKSNFLICRREVLEDLLRTRYKYKAYQTLLGVAIRCKHYSVRQIETMFDERRVGESFLPRFPFKMIWETVHDLVLGFFEFRLTDPYDASLRAFLKDKTPTNADEPLSWWREWYFRFYVWTFPLHHWMISYNAYQYYLDLKKSQWLKPEEIRAYQEQRLRQLLVHAYYKVPYYRRLFDANGIKPEDIRTIEDLARIPVLTKKIIKENVYSGLMSVDHDKSKILRVTTSGSTGEPTVVFAEKKQLEMRWAATLRATEWMGYRFGDRQIRLWHKYLGMKGMEVVKEILDAKMTRRKFVPAYEIDDENLSDFVDTLMSYKPVVLDGYAESYNLIARYLRQHKHDGWKPKGIMSSGQTLPPESRKIIEEGFGCKVFDKYGCRELVGGIAYQTGHEDYLVVAEGTIVEIIKDGRPAQPGELGEIVLTDLNNFAMPMIRYAIGDLAVAVDNTKPSPCGRGLPRIGRFYGRMQSILIGTRNQMIPGTFFARLFADYDYAVKRFQAVQERAGEITLKIVKANRWTDDVLHYATSQIKKHMGEDMKIRVEFVEEVALGRTGKRQHSVSMLNVSEVSNKFSTEMYDDQRPTPASGI